jgi:zinc protease
MIFTKILILILFITMAQESIAQEKLDRTKPPKSKPPKDIEFPDYYDTTLPNSINLLVIENYKVPSVSVRLVFKNAGSFQDSTDLGIASITSDLLTKGTKTRSAIQIADEVDFYGASLSSGADWDGSYITLSTLKKHLNKVIDVLVDVVLNPAFNEDEIKRLKEQRISSIIQGKDEASVLSDKLFNKVVFGNFPYSQPSEGTEESIKKLTRNQIQEFYNKHYCSNNLLLAFVGAISKEEALEIVNSKFRSWSKNCNENLLRDIVISSEYKPNRVYIVDKQDAVQSNLRIGHIGISRNNTSFLPVTVMNTILGGYFGSRINFNLREKHGFTYGARSSFSSRIYPGDFSVDTDVRNDVTDSSITLILEELNKIINEEVTDEELQMVKNYLTGTFPLQLETANAIATRVINLKLYGLPKNYYSTYISNINKLTKADILNAAKNYIHPDKIYIVLSGNSKAIKDKMKKFGEVSVYNADGNIIEN